MISILIPIYNEAILELVKTLQQQALANEVPFEIICLDDYSSQTYRTKNAALHHLEGVSYQELPENIGRANIRNRLAKLARFSFLLFMDGDSKVVRADYLKCYIAHLDQNCVIYGGRVYAPDPPKQPDHIFHWQYGCAREALAAADRTKYPYLTFMTNNFMVPKAIFQQIQFDESIRRYGYEDTLYALALKQAGISLVHLDNPLEHLGLETKEVFLQKVEDALENLVELRSKHPTLQTRLLTTYDKLQKWKLLGLIRFFIPFLLSGTRKVLLRNQGPLLLLDFYKLAYFIGANSR